MTEIEAIFEKLIAMRLIKRSSLLGCTPREIDRVSDYLGGNLPAEYSSSLADAASTVSLPEPISIIPWCSNLRIGRKI